MLVNPVAQFYEFFLTFFFSLPYAFQSYVGLVWGLTIVFALLNIFLRVMR